MEIPEGVRWDRKRSPEPNLHVCDEDDIKRAVYNMKESFEEGRSEHRKETKSTQKKTLETKELNLFKRKTNCYISANPSINVRLNRFFF